jgi:hypothetical protein
VIFDPVSFFAASQSAEGGWGYQPGRAAIIETTCAVILALKNQHQEIDLVQRAFSWLLEMQLTDGGWGMNRQDPRSAWMTAWAVWALAESSRSNVSARAGAQWLLNEPVMQISGLDDLIAGEKVAGIDFSLRGWPWQPGEASWVEPTALAVIALSYHTDLGAARLTEAVRYLENRRCQGGGWNVGNPVMFGSFLPARAQPTALAMLALHRIQPDLILEEDRQKLYLEALREDRAMALGWAGIAFAVCGGPVNEILTRLESRQGQNGSWGDDPFSTALAWLAFQEARK